MHKILKKTIKYGAAVLLTLIAVILTGIGYLYLSADMMTPQFASTPENGSCDTERQSPAIRRKLPAAQ